MTDFDIIALHPWWTETICDENVNSRYMAGNLPRLSNRPELARIMLVTLLDLGGASPEQRVSPRLMETNVGRRDTRRIGRAMQESARSAQRGLLVILASALLWAIAIWAGYHYFQ